MAKQKTKAKASAPVPLGNNTGQNKPPGGENGPNRPHVPGTGPQDTIPLPAWWGDPTQYRAWAAKREREIAKIRLSLYEL